MESPQLYRVKEEDLPRLEELLTGCFEHDPLYCKLIPDEEIRRRLLPELFACDLTEFYETCEIYSDSPEMNSLLVVSDESEPYNHRCGPPPPQTDLPEYVNPVGSGRYFPRIVCLLH